jgi:hypothetical protein
VLVVTAPEYYLILKNFLTNDGEPSGIRNGQSKNHITLAMVFNSGHSVMKISDWSSLDRFHIPFGPWLK